MCKKLLLTFILTVYHTVIPAADSTDVAVIYNTEYEFGYQIASYYAERRGIPDEQIIGIPMLTEEVVDKDYYYSNIRNPIRNEIESRGLKNKIKFLVTTKGMPLKIKVDPNYCNMFSQDGGGAVESFLCILFEDATDFCTSPRILNPYLDEGEEFESFKHQFLAYCPSETRGTISYLVSRLDAYTPEEVYAMIDRAVNADTTGRGYYILDDHPSAAGYEPSAMKDAAEFLDSLGLNEYVLYDSTTYHITSDTLQDKNFAGYCSRGRHASGPNGHLGWTEEAGYLGGNRFNWVNGAIFTTYESFNGYSFYYVDDGCPYAFPTGQKLGHRDHQNLVADFIRDGGTAGIGNVFEPFVTGASNVDVLFRYYAEGYTFVESAYMSLRFITGMNVVTGDPLCRIKPVYDATPSDTMRPRIILHNNFPNPFSINTSISYKLNYPGKIKVSVYNILGEEVISLPEEFRTPGIYNILVSFTSLPSGIYFYRITSEGKTAAGKMAQLKENRLK